jgi:hypothetical protein
LRLRYGQLHAVALGERGEGVCLFALSEVPHLTLWYLHANELQRGGLGKIRDTGHPAAYLLRVVRTNALRTGHVDPGVAEGASLGGLLSREAGSPEVAPHQRIVFASVAGMA